MIGESATVKTPADVEDDSCVRYGDRRWFFQPGSFSSSAGGKLLSFFMLVPILVGPVEPFAMAVDAGVVVVFVSKGRLKRPCAQLTGEAASKGDRRR